MNRFTTSFITSTTLPMVIEPSTHGISLDEFLDMLQTNNSFFKDSLVRCGGLLFRNFPVKNQEDFAAVIKALGTGSFKNYAGGDSPRTKTKEGIYTSTEAPPSIKIPLHNELSYVKRSPRYIYFYCDVSPIDKGETILADSRKVYRAIDNDVKRRFIDKGLRYVSCYYHKSRLMDFINSIQRGHKTWVDVFETEDKKEVERLCRENDFDFKWNKNDWLEISQIRPATTQHPETSETVWYNQAHLFDFNPRLLGWWRYLGTKILYAQDYMKLHQVFFGDNSVIPREDLYHIMDVLDANTVAFSWQKGDVLVLDNVLSMHGRAPFTGKRRILTAMTG